jgi:hypothetical protein
MKAAKVMRSMFDWLPDVGPPTLFIASRKVTKSRVYTILRWQVLAVKTILNIDNIAEVMAAADTETVHRYLNASQP